MTRILLVDDHAVLRSGVRRILEEVDDLTVVGEAADADTALRLARRESPDVVVLDITLKGPRTGIDIVPGLRSLGARVVILSMQDVPAYARRALEACAQAFVVKDAVDEELTAAVRAVLEDRMYVNPGLAARLVTAHAEDDLTDREREILRLIALGYTNQEIAGQLYLSVRTIEAHRRNILNKLRLDTRADLVRYALEHRIVGLGL